MFGSFLSYLRLISAMQRPGCPICRIRDEKEKSYLENLLLDHVNDAETQNHIIESVGYCPHHTWQMGFLEQAIYHDSVKNSMIYESLVKSVTNSMKKYYRRETAREKGISGLIHRLFRKDKRDSFEQDPFAREALSGCYICHIGDDTEQLFLYSLLRGFNEHGDDIRQIYHESNGLCLHHFRRAFTISGTSLNVGLNFLVEETVQKIVTLGNDLTSYIDKHAYNRCHEPMSDGERYSWLRVLRFFGRNEEIYNPDHNRYEGDDGILLSQKEPNDQPSPMTFHKGEPLIH